MKRILLVLAVIILYSSHDPINDYDPTISINAQMQARDSIADYLESQGWTSDAAYIIASFDTDLMDQSDMAEYALYVGYMED